MRIKPTQLLFAITLLLSPSCSKDESGDILPVSKSIVAEQSSVGSFTASVSCTLEGVDKIDIALGRHGVLYCTKSDDVDKLFKAWLDGVDNPDCNVWEISTVQGESMRCIIDGLTPDIEYSYCFFIQKRDGSREIGPVSTFKTQVFNPEIKSVVIRDIGCFSATAESDIGINDNDAVYCNLGIIVSTQPDCNINNSIVFSTTGPRTIMVLSGLDAEMDYYCRSYIKYPVQDGKYEYIYGPEFVFRTKGIQDIAVDLGLSVYWATCNIGASTPYEHGNLYAWGELTTKNSYNGWLTYKWYQSGTRLTKYNSYSAYGKVDYKTVLEREDDVAYVTIGGKSRMPTKREYEELIHNCKWEWEKRGDIEGYRVTSLVPGYTDRSIFLRCSGGDWGGGARRNVHFAYYWTAEADDVPGKSSALYFGEETYGTSSGDRYVGFSVRPVIQSPRAEKMTIELSRSALCLTETGEFLLNAEVRQNYNVLSADITYTSSNSSVATINNSGLIHAVSPGTCIITAETGMARAECQVHVVSPQVNPQKIDLGLSVKWASFNLGADSPEEVGYYIAWGETEPKNNYSINTYKYNNSNSGMHIVKYCDNSEWGVVDNKRILEKMDDASTVLWGADWRTPTHAEMDELHRKCTWVWTTLNGIEGYKITSNVSGYTDNSIFLPAAGICFENRHLGLGRLGHYWTASTTSASYAASWDMLFNHDASYYFSGSRFFGCSVRPVYIGNQ